jgi:hypothetical protein
MSNNLTGEQILSRVSKRVTPGYESYLLRMCPSFCDYVSAPYCHHTLFVKLVTVSTGQKH